MKAGNGAAPTRCAALRQARWHQHVLALGAPAPLRHWLAGDGSLTAKLKAHSAAFRVHCLRQATARCLSDEAAAIGLGRPGRVWEREVLLRCDNRPVVFAHTVVPMSATAADWPLFSALGERSLGSTLFGDPRVRRGELEFARLRAGHPLARRARLALGLEPAPGLDPETGLALGLEPAPGLDPEPGLELEPRLALQAAQNHLLYARRCLYRRRQGTLLVTEVFLPSVLELVLHNNK